MGLVVHSLSRGQGKLKEAVISTTINCWKPRIQPGLTNVSVNATHSLCSNN